MRWETIFHVTADKGCKNSAEKRRKTRRKRETETGKKQLASDQKTPKQYEGGPDMRNARRHTWRILSAYFFGYWRTSGQDARRMSPF